MAPATHRGNPDAPQAVTLRRPRYGADEKCELGRPPRRQQLLVDRRDLIHLIGHGRARRDSRLQAREQIRLIDADIARSRRMVLKKWRSRRFGRRVNERLALLLRSQL